MYHVTQKVFSSDSPFTSILSAVSRKRSIAMYMLPESFWWSCGGQWSKIKVKKWLDFVWRGRKLSNMILCCYMDGQSLLRHITSSKYDVLEIRWLFSRSIHRSTQEATQHGLHIKFFRMSLGQWRKYVVSTCPGNKHLKT